MSNGPLSTDQIAAFHRDGFLRLPAYFNAAEMSLLLSYAKEDRELTANAMPMTDAAGRQSKLALWNHPGDDLYGMFSRCGRVVDGAAQLLDEEVYHWHSKMMLKEPRIGGAWEWHQDYGYWYLNHCLRPDLVSCMVAVDRANQANGCLQVLRGSHRLGRIDHGRFGKQVGADPERVEQAIAHFGLEYFTAEPGDALFFHANTLHTSGQNLSEFSRWSLIMTYNARSNSPFKGPFTHPEYTPLLRVDDDAILTWPSRRHTATRASFMRLEDNMVTIDAAEYFSVSSR